MPVIDITQNILSRDMNQIREIRTWLSENVGEYYGRGIDPVIDIGSGWEIVAQRYEEDEYILTSWVVDISDERLAMLFKLRWA